MAATPSFLLKLERAREHLQAFDNEARTWIDGKPYGIVDEPDPEPPPQPLPDGFVARRCRITRVGDIPERLSPIAGDCLFNLRSALDHLALSLARTHTPRMTDKEIAGSEFPVFQSNTMDAKTEQRKIGCLSPAARAAVKAMQPYHRGHGYAADILWQIHELNRIDKHRSLTVIAVRSAATDVNGVTKDVIQFTIGGDENIGGIGYLINSGNFRIEADAILTRWAAMPRDAGRDVQLHPNLPLQVVFGDGGPAALRPVVATLRGLCDHVGNVVIPQLAKFL